MEGLSQTNDECVFVDGTSAGTYTIEASPSSGGISNEYDLEVSTETPGEGCPD